MSDIAKEMQEKISTTKGFGSITRADIHNLLQLIDQQAMEINYKDMHIKSLQDQLDRTQKQLQASRESVYGISVESDEAKFERRIAQESLELAIKALEQINVKYMEYIENSIECDYAALKMDEIAEKALEEIKRLGEGVKP